jgi:hypothetical protein
MIQLRRRAMRRRTPSNEEFLAQLPTDAEAKEAAVEQRSILALFEMQRRN